MSGILEWSLTDWVTQLKRAVGFVFKRWYLLLLSIIAGAAWGYYSGKKIKPLYTATISFVLSTESRGAGGGFAGVAAQFGVDLGGGQENVFSGDNIIELFKSRKMVTQALMSIPEPATGKTLLNIIASEEYADQKSVLPFPSKVTAFSLQQNVLFRKIIKELSDSFTVFKKDKRLVFYYISTNSESEKIAYYTSKCMLDQTSKFFIDTKTSAATRNYRLLQKEADSLSGVLNRTFRSSASLADRTYNINPSMMVQRYGAQANQSKSMAISAAYAEVLRGLEMAKMNVLKETPLFSVIDETDMPIVPEEVNLVKRCAIWMIAGALVMGFMLFCFYMFSSMFRTP